MASVCIICEFLLTLIVVGSQSVRSNDTITESPEISNESPNTECPDNCSCQNERKTVYCFNGWNQISILNMSDRTETIVLKNGNVHTLTAGLFKELLNVTELTFVNSGINEISPGAFDGLNQLKFLRLSDNDIKTIAKGTFEPLQSLQNLILRNNNIVEIGDGAFAGLHNLVMLWLKNNVRRIHPGAFDDLGSVETLVLQYNFFEEIVPGTLKGLHNVIQMELGYNNITRIENGTFEGLHNLASLELGHNSITRIENGAFEGLHSLTQLWLNNNPIVTIALGGFNGLTGLTFLNISVNKLTSIESWFGDMGKLQELSAINTPFEVIQSNAFQGLGQLKTMTLTRGDDTRGRQIDVKDGALDGLVMFQEIIVEERRICCLFVSALPSFNKNDCLPTEPRWWDTLKLYHCGRLMWSNGMRACLWIIGVTSFTGNLLVVVQRCWLGRVANESEVHTFMVLNLALSDLLMGVYMLIMALADSTYGETYSNHAEEWRSGTVCRIAEVLSVLSCEASVFFITLIGVECFLLIVYPLSGIKIRVGTSKISVGVIWVLAGCLSVPFLGTLERGVTDMCITLPLVPIPKGKDISRFDSGGFDNKSFVEFVPERPKPRVYSIILFIVINLLCFSALLCCYVAIFVSIKRSAKRMKMTARRKRETLLAVKMMMVVVTDFACWMPVIIMGILSQTGAAEITPDAFAWTAVLILPINSSLNPIIYTLYTKLAANS